MINIIVSGIDKLKKANRIFEQSRRELHKQLVETSRKFSYDIVNTSKLNYLSGPRPDKLDIKTGRLRDSIRSRVITDGSHIQVIMGSHVVYAQIHEFGGYTGRGHKAYLRPRPFLKTAIADEFPQFKEKLERVLGKAGIVDKLKDLQ